MVNAWVVRALQAPAGGKKGGASLQCNGEGSMTVYAHRFRLTLRDGQPVEFGPEASAHFMITAGRLTGQVPGGHADEMVQTFEVQYGADQHAGHYLLRLDVPGAAHIVHDRVAGKTQKGPGAGKVGRPADGGNRPSPHQIAPGIHKCVLSNEPVPGSGRSGWSDFSWHAPDCTWYTPDGEELLGP